MAATVTRAGLAAPFRTRTAHFIPPVRPSDFDFAWWLAERTPLGAPTLAVRPPGALPLIQLPQIRPAAASPNSWLGRKRRGSAPAVHAAYLHDIVGMTPPDLVRCGFFSFTTERGARHYIRDGRLTAADLGMWPWAVIDGRPLPRNWWADREFASALQAWATA